jgi:hypothetical protein
MIWASISWNAVCHRGFYADYSGHFCDAGMLEANTWTVLCFTIMRARGWQRSEPHGGKMGREPGSRPWSLSRSRAHRTLHGPITRASRASFLVLFRPRDVSHPSAKPLSRVPSAIQKGLDGALAHFDPSSVLRVS